MFRKSSESLLDWLEMKKLRTKNFDSDVWIPLLSVDSCSEGEIFHPGYKNVDYCVRTLLVAGKDFDNVQKLEWNDLCFHYESRSCVETDGTYVSCDEARESIRKDPSERIGDDDWFVPINCIYPVLVQFWSKDKPEVWHLHQDIVIALNLLQDGDTWVRPEEDYIDVARLIRNDESRPIRLEIKNEFLKDYLCARGMGLYVACYRNRQEFFAEKPNLNWKFGITEVKQDHYRWWGSLNEVSDNGFRVGEKATVINARRTDVDSDDDVPVMGFPKDDCIESYTQEVSLASKSVVYETRGEIWKYELIKPGLVSIRIREDEPQNPPTFKIDAAGQSLSSRELLDESRWLWFKANVVNELLSKKDSVLKWYTKDTGGIGCGSYNVQFGINDSGLITVYAKDIALLPFWLQQVWAGFNVSPDAGVSKELLMSQVEATPAETVAPEGMLNFEYKRLNETFKLKFNVDLFNITSNVECLLTNLSRFESVSEEGFFVLSKKLAKLTTDSINYRKIQNLLDNVDEDWRSLRTLQEILIQKAHMSENDAKELMSPLFGINDLRQKDAHINGPNVDKALSSVRIENSPIPLFRGRDLLFSFVETLHNIETVLSTAV